MKKKRKRKKGKEKRNGRKSVHFFRFCFLFEHVIRNAAEEKDVEKGEGGRRGSPSRARCRASASIISLRRKNRNEEGREGEEGRVEGS